MKKTILKGLSIATLLGCLTSPVSAATTLQPPDQKYFTNAPSEITSYVSENITRAVYPVYHRSIIGKYQGQVTCFGDSSSPTMPMTILKVSNYLYAGSTLKNAAANVDVNSIYVQAAAAKAGDGYVYKSGTSYKTESVHTSNYNGNTLVYYTKDSL